MRVTPQHWEVFLNACENHSNLITGKFNGAQGKTEGNALWTKLTTELNGLGLGEKSVVEWRRAVTDWKSKVKAKAPRIKQLAVKTGGGPFTSPPLTSIEEKLISIMGTKGIDGDHGVRELGIPLVQGQPEEICENVVEEIVINESVPSTSFTPQATPHDEPFKNKRKHDEKEHNYCGVNDRGKRIKIKNIPRISKNIEDMTSQSLAIMKNIEKNTSRIADSLEELINILQQQQNLLVST